MRRPLFFAASVAVVIALVAACTGGGTTPQERTLSSNASVVSTDDGPRVALRTKQGDVTFWTGVNLGPALPGSSPGELAATAEDYRRWMTEMQTLGVQFLRIYTILPPDFYRELAAHNTANPDSPLWLIQGVYLPSESYIKSGDLYSMDMTGSFTAELQDAVAAVYGTLDRPDPIPGRASGQWTVDVSEWLAAWIIGAELDPEAVKKSDTRNADKASFAGTYFSTVGENVTPTEAWYAARMNDLAVAQSPYGDSEPIAFINWPTTDPLEHPTEPRWQEDHVSINANHITATDAWTGGTFASYHAYPYYPDFLRYTPEYGPDPYAGYLTALKDYHAQAGLPTMVTEYGVPSSIGSAHNGTLGRDHGGHSEAEAMQMDADLTRTIYDAGMAGAILFAWVDEWFKVTWNTQPRQSVVDSERRALWHDPLTVEQWFGLHATDPVLVGRRVPYESREHVREIAVDHDASFLHLDTVLDEAPTTPVTWTFTVLPDSPHPDGDVRLVYDPTARTMTAYVQATLDPTRLDGLDEADFPTPTDGTWVPQSQTLNRTYPAEGGNPERPAEFHPVGNMIEGDWNPASSDYNSLATWNLSDDGKTIRVRIPWSMLLLGDPSSRTASYPDPTVTVPSSPLSPIPALGAAVRKIDLTVAYDNQTTPAVPIEWEKWNTVNWVERPKQGLNAIQDVWGELGSR